MLSENNQLPSSFSKQLRAEQPSPGRAPCRELPPSSPETCQWVCPWDFSSAWLLEKGSCRDSPLAELLESDVDVTGVRAHSYRYTEIYVGT